MNVQPHPDVFDGWARNLADIVLIRVFQRHAVEPCQAPLAPVGEVFDFAQAGLAAAVARRGYLQCMRRPSENTAPAWTGYSSVLMNFICPLLLMVLSEAAPGV